MIDLTSAQIHLAVNHLPVFGAVLATATLAIAMVTRRASTRNLGLGLLVFAALASLPTYFSGKNAEEIVERRPGVSEALIEHHEEAAEQALAVMLAAGSLAAVALLAVRLRREAAGRLLAAVTLLCSLASAGLMGRVAHLGGQIRHDEIRPQVGSSELSQPSQRPGRRLQRDDD